MYIVPMVMTRNQNVMHMTILDMSVCLEDTQSATRAVNTCTHVSVLPNAEK